MNKESVKPKEVNANVVTENFEEYNINGTIVRVKYKQGGKTLTQILEEYLFKL